MRTTRPPTSLPATSGPGASTSLHPLGWDAFGLPAEQHAVKTGTHPASNTQNNIANFKRQVKQFGYSYDWDREIDTTDPRYFRWTQWIFLQLFKQGLAYVDERPVWWCPELRTVLANEEIVDGKSEVGGFPVERRNLRQWVLRITAYAERLLAGLKHVDWPDSTKRMQEAWIGRSEGAEILFALENAALGPLKIFTTRPDTLFGCTYMVVAPEHPLVDALTTPEQKAAVEAYRKKAAGKSDLERTDLAKDKSGVFSGSFAVNPVNGQRVPVWIADYVLMGYGTGAIMAVPAHDERDHEFAVRYSLPVIQVIQPAGQAVTLPYTGDGQLIGSGDYNGLDWPEAKRRITADLATRRVGKATVNYKLRDWLFSRQRYWGEPFPIVWVGEADYRRAAATRKNDVPAEPVTFTSAGVTHYALPLPPQALPLQLPEVQSYLPSGNGESPLANETAWLEIWVNFETGEAVPASNPSPPAPPGCGGAARPTRCRSGPAPAGTTCGSSIPGTTPPSPRPRRCATGACRTFMSAAPSTPCSTCSTPASGTRSSSTSASCRKASRSPSCSTRASSSVRTAKKCRRAAAMS